MRRQGVDSQVLWHLHPLKSLETLILQKELQRILLENAQSICEVMVTPYQLFAQDKVVPFYPRAESMTQIF